MDKIMVTPAPPGLLFKLPISGDALQRFIELLQRLMVMHTAGLALHMQISLAAALTNGHNDNVLETK